MDENLAQNSGWLNGASLLPLYYGPTVTKMNKSET
jgi:hypothetical protein